MNYEATYHLTQREKCKASIGIMGLSGTGKSGLAQILAYYLAHKDWQKIYATDSEKKSLNLFVGIPSSLGIPFEPIFAASLDEDLGYDPLYYKAMREGAIQDGAEVSLIDSLSHAWQGKGGVLETVNEETAKASHNNKHAIWGLPIIIEKKTAVFDLVRDERVHCISTIRTKEKSETTKDEDGNTVVVSLGMEGIMPPNMKFEFDLVLEMVEPGSKNTHPKARVIKTRYAILEKDAVYEFTPELIQSICDYLEEGADPEELLEEQRQEYIEQIKSFMQAHEQMLPIWNTLKADAGYGDTDLDDIPREGVRELLLKLME